MQRKKKKFKYQNYFKNWGLIIITKELIKSIKPSIKFLYQLKKKNLFIILQPKIFNF